MKSKEFKELLRKAATRLPTSVVIMVQVLAETKLQQILKKGGTGRPIIIIYGEPGNGKTSSVQALLEECLEIKFADGLKTIKKAITGMKGTGKLKILFLDNFPQPLSAYKLEAGRRILDYVIDIASEDSEAPIAIMTGEPNMIDEVKKAGYLAGRSLVVKMPKIDSDEELYNIRRYFSMNRAEYLEHWKDYAGWLEQNPAEEADVLRELEKFREKYCKKYENRRVGLVFCYFYAMRRYSKFLESEYGEGISVDAVEGNVRELLDWEEEAGRTRSCYEVDVWNGFIEDGGIGRVIMPHASVCSLLVKAGCSEYEDSYQCYRCVEGDWIDKYHPMDLRLPADSDDAILIEKPGLIPDFPRHIVCKEPLLMIRSASLVEMLNTYLEAYSRKKGICVRRITPKKLTKELFSHNLCLFEYVGTGHNTYTFRMKDRSNKDVRVVFIKLTTDQYERLKADAKTFGWTRNYTEDEVLGMNACIKYFCENVQSLIGDVGKPSMVQEDIK